MPEKNLPDFDKEARKLFEKHLEENKGKPYKSDVKAAVAAELRAFDQGLVPEDWKGKFSEINKLSAEELEKLLRATEEGIEGIRTKVESLYREGKNTRPQSVDLSPSQTKDLVENWTILLRQEKIIKNLLKKSGNALRTNKPSSRS